MKNSSGKIIEISTCHLREETIANLIESEHLPFSVWHNEYGIILSTHAFETETFKPTIPDDIAAVQKFGRDHDADYVMLDRDATGDGLEGIDDLPEYDW